MDSLEVLPLVSYGTSPHSTLVECKYQTLHIRIYTIYTICAMDVKINVAQ